MIINHNTKEEYEIIDEQENTINNPNKAKDHIADYFEDLYQARDGENSHKTWTHHINNTVERISKDTAKSQNETPFSKEELTTSIKKLKRKKSTGPDLMPNEIFIEADEKTKEIYLYTLNLIYTSEKIPQQWQHGEIKRIYKGKGKKGKCSNERGITLASNFGKLFERIMNDRIKKETKITEAQAGGQKGVATADHLMILNSIINQTKKQRKKQELHIVFLDVTKAYDKAWLKAILYTLNKSGLQGKNWRIAKELNENLTATIRTQYGPTRTINIRDSIRQGGVLSVIEYANLMDDIAKELLNNAIGTQQLGINNIPGCLLWVDDVALIHKDRNELQNMLDTTNEIANRYRIKFGREKSQILTINKKQGNTETKMGDLILDQTETYKYLGVTINNKGNMEDHIKKLKGKTEAAIQTIFSLAGNDEFHNIEMATIWRLFNTCITPIITYGAEAWTPTKAEEKALQRIRDNLLKRILKTPITTPSEILTAETGIWDIETQIMKKQILYYRTIITTKNKDTTIYKVATDANNPWKKRVENTIRITGINEEDLITKNPIQAKKYITQRLMEYQINKIYSAAENKSKVQDYIWNKTRETIMKKPTYMNNQTRKECSNLFAVRSRMLKVKGNYKSKHTNLICRWCKLKEESQIHILTECKEFQSITKYNKYETYYDDENHTAAIATQIMGKVVAKIEEQEKSNEPN
jgi:hypothetical protein